MKAKITDRDKPVIQTSDKFIWFAGGDFTTLENAKLKLIELIKTDIKENTEISLESNIVSDIKSLNINVLSYNLRQPFEEDLRNPDDVIVSIRNLNPDIFGVQEDTSAWLKKLNNAFGSQYSRVLGKPADKSGMVRNCIFYRATDYELLENGTKWLSATPDVLSKFNESKHYKTFTYAKFRHRASGICFMYVNVHMDYNSDNEQKNAAHQLQFPVLLNFLKEHSDIPIILGGDFNTTPTNKAIKILTDDTRFVNSTTIAKVKIDNPTLVNNYTTLNVYVFDYLFVSSDTITVNRYEAVDNKMNGKYPSDHLPVQADLTIWQVE